MVLVDGEDDLDGSVIRSWVHGPVDEYGDFSRGFGGADVGEGKTPTSLVFVCTKGVRRVEGRGRPWRV